MELSAEDALRLNVLLANKPLAIRIHESSMTLYGLLPEGEATVKLTPVGSDEKYLKAVRGFLSEKALGSPGGYPLYLQRWTRQGQMRQDSLEQLLLLGDPTAVFAVVCAGGLTDELGRRAWWAAEEAENARRLLQTEAVVRGETGKKLARYLIDYLPFETETETMVESVRLALQPELLDSDARNELWKRSARKTAYLLGFLAAMPNDLPDQLPARADYDDATEKLTALIETGNQTAALLQRLLSAPGQTFLSTSLRILDKPPTQDIVNTTLDVLRDYCLAVRHEGDPDLTIEELAAEADRYISEAAEAVACLQQIPALQSELRALRILSGGGYGVLRPVLKGTTAVGSLMRRKLAPVLDPYTQQIRTLLASD
jgi:hypothetical protein